MYFNLRGKMANEEQKRRLSVDFSSYLSRISTELDKTIDFWLRHSHDKVNGGFFSCLTKEGKVYDATKFGWLNGRQVWLYSQLFEHTERFRHKEVEEAALNGAKFLMTRMKDASTRRVYFATTAEGKPKKLQRSIFAEVFYAMAMAAAAKLGNKDAFKREALDMFDRVVSWSRDDDSDLGRDKLEGNDVKQTFSDPMWILALVHAVEDIDDESELDLEDVRGWAVHRLKMHVQRDGARVLEIVTPDGREIEGSEGRKMIPGHSIEAGCFLLEEARRKKDDELRDYAIQHFIASPFEYGWDKQYGGLFYYLDVDGFPCTQLEWDMKLWWPHTVAMIAFLKAFDMTGDETHWRKFKAVADYAFKHFADNEHGEWFGYLNRQGKVSSPIKGGPFKGCYHVPRALLVAELILTNSSQLKAL